MLNLSILFKRQPKRLTGAEWYKLITDQIIIAPCGWQGDSFFTEDITKDEFYERRANSACIKQK